MLHPVHHILPQIRYHRLVMRSCRAAGVAVMDAYLMQGKSTFTSLHLPCLAPPSTVLPCFLRTRRAADSRGQDMNTCSSLAAKSAFFSQSSSSLLGPAGRRDGTTSSSRSRSICSSSSSSSNSGGSRHGRKEHQQSQPPEIFFSGEQSQRILQRCPTLHHPYAQFPDPIGDGHVETLMGALLRKRLPMQYR